MLSGKRVNVLGKQEELLLYFCWCVTKNNIYQPEFTCYGVDREETLQGAKQILWYWGIRLHPSKYLFTQNSDSAIPNRTSTTNSAVVL